MTGLLKKYWEIIEAEGRPSGYSGESQNENAVCKRTEVAAGH